MDLDVRNLVYELLPPHKRKPVRLAWLTSLLAPLAALWDEFHAWRADMRVLARVRGQRAVLEEYLKRKYSLGMGFRIETYSDGLLWFPLVGESDEMMPAFPLLSEASGAALQEIPLADESRSRFDGVDFIVYLPSTADYAMVAAEIDRYKPVLTTYRIEQQILRS